MLGDDPMRERRRRSGRTTSATSRTRATPRASSTPPGGPGRRTSAGPSARPPAAGAAAAKAKAAPRTAARPPRAGPPQRAGALVGLPGWAWFAALLLGTGALAYGLAGSRLVTAVLVVLTTVLLVRVPVQPRRPRTLFRLVRTDTVARALLVVAVLAAVTGADRLGSRTRPAGLRARRGRGRRTPGGRLERAVAAHPEPARACARAAGEPYPGVLVLLTALLELLVLGGAGPVVLGNGRGRPRARGGRRRGRWGWTGSGTARPVTPPGAPRSPRTTRATRSSWARTSPRRTR